jgi:deoxyribose-phosphate aldolase
VDIETIQFLREMLSAKFGIKVGGEIADARSANELLKTGATHFATNIVPQFQGA